MKRFRFIDLVVGFCMLFGSRAVVAQHWPYPANTPNVEVPCADCSGNAHGKLTPGYADPISGFTGRFLDSTEVIDFQGGFRTGRAYLARYSPQKDRIYLQLGSALAAYSKSTFFSRLQSREPLVAPNSLSGVGRLESVHAALPELMLRWDQWFYAESSASNWRTVIIDGQDRLADYSIDDRGNVYIAYSVFGWGIVKDLGSNDASIMQGPQFFPNGSPGNIDSASNVFAVKTSNGKYYALVQGSGANAVQVYDVTNVDNPVQQNPDFRQFFQKAVPTSDRTAIVTADGKLLIYNNDAFIVNGAPLQTFLPPLGGRYASVDTDGTNFYAALQSSSYQVSLLKLTGDASRNSFSGTPVLVSNGNPQLEPRTLRYGDGYLAMVVNDFNVGIDLRLYRVDGSSFTEIPLNHYFNDYYIAVQGYKENTSNYVSVAKGLMWDVLPIKNNNKLHLIVSAYDLGDVYQIRSEDDVAVAAQGAVGTVNPNAPARPTGTLFYGDKVRFLGSTSSPTPKTLAWNFGNPEAAAGADPNTLANSSTGIPVDHQYSGITPATLGSARTVTATNTGGSGVGQTSVNLTTGTARIGVTNGTSSFSYITNATTAASAPVVAGDSFFDGSDGDVEGHYAEWTIDNVSTSKVPYAANGSHLMNAGVCGAHTLTYAAHYGPHVNFATAGGADFRVALSGLSYNVQPFTAAIGNFTDGGTSLVFSSISRASTDTTALPTAQAGALSWRWDLVDGGENVVLAGPAGTGSITSISQWSVPKTSFTSIGLRVRLQITTTPALTGTCAGKETSKAFTKALNGPDPVIGGGCTNGGPPCNFSITSQSGVNMTSDGWHFSWSATGPATVIGGEDKSTYAPVFTATGSYTVSVTVSNAIGSKTVTQGVSVTTVGILCPTMNDFNIYPVYLNSSLTCTVSQNAGCSVGTSLTFGAQTNSYDINCAAHTYEWDFGDNTQHSTQASPTHAYGAAGTYTITMTVKNPTQTYVGHGSITVGGIVQPPPPPPPPPPTGKCPTMSALNLYPVYRGTSDPCNSANQATCGTGELVTLLVQPNGYDLGCDSHTFSWSFGDNTTGSGSITTHTYTNPGNYTITLTVSNSSQFNYTSTIPVKITGSGSGGKCKTMTSDNLTAGYRNASFSCSAANNAGCTTSELLTFLPQPSGYDLSCSTHTYDWNFGDNTAHSTLANPTHQYTLPGTYTITMKVHNDQQDYTNTGQIIVKSSQVTPQFKADFTAATPDTSRPLLAVFTPSVDPANTAVTKVTWDFGDGSSPFSKPNLAQVTNLYSKAGTYAVSMTVEAGGQSVQTSHSVIIVLPSRTRAVRH